MSSRLSLAIFRSVSNGACRGPSPKPSDLIPSLTLHSAALKDLRFVVKALKTLSARWEDIGMAVDVKGLDEIKRNYQGMYMYIQVTVKSL